MITVHCFACSHSVRGYSPGQAHDAMEAHYASVHAAVIRKLVGKP